MSHWWWLDRNSPVLLVPLKESENTSYNFWDRIVFFSPWKKLIGVEIELGTYIAQGIDA